MRGLSTRTIELILFARALLAEFNPMTLRQLHYAIFSAAMIAYDNKKADYKRLSRVTSKARRLYRAHELAGVPEHLMPSHAIPPDWIVDEIREAELVSMWKDMHGYMETVRRSYRRDNWQDQPNHCEVWSEKATLLGSLRPITEEYGVRLRVCHGFGSTGQESQIGDVFEGIDKPITVFYVGDHDPSGRDIQRDIHKRAQLASGRDFEMVKLAIHPADIRTFNLPPQKIKLTDSRARGFQKQFGKKAPTVELDALPVEELRRRVTEAVKNLIDFDLWNRQVTVQTAELDCIARFADTVKNLPQQAG
jgi:hypothetical protein